MPARTAADIFQVARDSDAPLNERLATFAAAIDALGVPLVPRIDRLVARLRAAGAGLQAPGIGAPMPPFLLPDDAARLVGLDELIANGPVAVAFHRGHWCPYCRINAEGLSRIHAQATAAGGQIVAITPERQQFAREHKRDAGASFHMLTDFASSYSLSLNLAIWVGEEMKQHLMTSGRDLAHYHGADAWFLPIPVTFVVGTDGIVTARFIDPDYRKRMDLNVLLDALRAAR